MGEPLRDDEDRSADRAARREDRIARLRAGRERTKRAGGRVGGQPHYGWTAYRGTVGPDPDEQGPLWLMTHLAGLGWSLQRIADHLNALRIPTRSGRPWNRTTLHPIIRRATNRAAAAPARSGQLALGEGSGDG